MSADQNLRDAASRLVAETTAAQNLPLAVTDPTVLAKVASTVKAAARQGGGRAQQVA